MKLWGADAKFISFSTLIHLGVVGGVLAATNVARRTKTLEEKPTGSRALSVMTSFPDESVADKSEPSASSSSTDVVVAKVTKSPIVKPPVVKVAAAAERPTRLPEKSAAKSGRPLASSLTNDANLKDKSVRSALLKARETNEARQAVEPREESDQVVTKASQSAQWKVAEAERSAVEMAEAESALASLSSDTEDLDLPVAEEPRSLQAQYEENLARELGESTRAAEPTDTATVNNRVAVTNKGASTSNNVASKDVTPDLLEGESFAAVTGGGPVRDGDDLKERPGNQKPEYPLQDRLAKRQGVVTFLARVTPDGQVKEISIVKNSSSRSLDAAALKVFQDYRYMPGQEGWVLKNFNFRLNGQVQETQTKLRRAQNG